MAKKKVFVSFDYENDKRYKFLLQAWDANKQFEFSFADQSSREISSNNVGRVKAGLTRRINSARYTLVIIGKEANKLHRDRKLIGYRNWINFEIDKSKTNGNKLVGVKISKSYESPECLLNSGATWAMSFTEQAVVKALNQA